MLRKSTPIPLIWLLLYIVVTPVPLFNYVLCVSADGHVEIEVGTNGRCTDAHAFDSERGEALLTETPSDADHCGSCADHAIFFSLDKQPHVVPAKDMPVHHTVSAVGLAASQPRAPTIPICAPHFCAPTLVNPTPKSLRSTTFRI